MSSSPPKHAPLHFGHWINGREVFANLSTSTQDVRGAGTPRPATLKVLSPVTQGVAAEFPNADKTTVDQAVAAAQTAFTQTPWAKDKGLRVATLHRMAGVLRANTERLAELEVQQMGRPLKEMKVGIVVEKKVRLGDHEGDRQHDHTLSNNDDS